MTTGVPERPLQIEHADLSLIGHREENQDRVAIADADGTVMLAVVDGMGGHADGARAAEVAMRAMLNEFWEVSRPLFDGTALVPVLSVSVITATPSTGPGSAP